MKHFPSIAALFLLPIFAILIYIFFATVSAHEIKHTENYSERSIELIPFGKPFLTIREHYSYSIALNQNQPLRRPVSKTELLYFDYYQFVLGLLFLALCTFFLGLLLGKFFNPKQTFLTSET